MRILTGTDIIEISRIKDSMENRGEIFQNKIFTDKEIAYCESKKNAKYEHYAGRFAAKEATYKAISDLLNDKFEVSWKDAEILNDANGKPYLIFTNPTLLHKIDKVDISISHCKEYATASVVVISK